MHIGTMRNTMRTSAQYGIVSVPVTIFFQWVQNLQWNTWLNENSEQSQRKHANLWQLVYSRVIRNLLVSEFCPLLLSFVHCCKIPKVFNKINSIIDQLSLAVHFHFTHIKPLLCIPNLYTFSKQILYFSIFHSKAHTHTHMHTQEFLKTDH
jgi:hypothetical protein